jgi:hypothetical protein
VSRLRDRVVQVVGTRGELALYELDRATEIRCARCAGRSVTRSVAVLGDDRTSLFCKSCYLAMPAPAPERASDIPTDLDLALDGRTLMTTPPDEAPLRGRIAARLRTASADVGDARARQMPAPVVLAITRRAFAVAGLASILLDENAVPARDAYQAAEQQCRLALPLLDKALGPELVKRYGAGTLKADVDEMSRTGPPSCTCRTTPASRSSPAP